MLPLPETGFCLMVADYLLTGEVFMAVLIVSTDRQPLLDGWHACCCTAAAYRFGRCGSITRSTASTAIGDISAVCCEMTLLLSDLQHQHRDEAERHTGSKSGGTAVCVLEHKHMAGNTGSLLCDNICCGPQQATKPCLLNHPWCFAAHVLAALISDSLSSRLTGMAIDSKTCNSASKGM